ncbi:hypothetical protein SARC_04490 [Sphaeroforma arctica JP610]|uniref:Sister chromatid cohesion protein DCC1 n=1 Tax=Sphaeroforma arctica JP610 TaxID=667725 RepID=A0A0L0G4S7_9EUKA|nr:hypothetical protein SARC_04490 [Sphaeroforma arctica JP610]KNC83253.1 hypothetical protein SARC_04490 [Sphaeroforma arctica JP610]|eukprot:XP_014157155.1 hypothetical protein SARC_04490 [Sphaeroforma arctica JP610]
MLAAADMTDIDSTQQTTRAFSHTTNKCHIPLVFSEDFSHEALELFAFPPDMIQQLECGTKFYIKGNAEEDAVLCTLSETFMLRSADTSNSLLVSERMNASEESVVPGDTKAGMVISKDKKGGASDPKDDRSIETDPTGGTKTDTTDNSHGNKRAREAMPSEAAFWASQSQRPRAKEMIKVHAIAKTCYELKKTRPRIERLPQLLHECPYSGEGDDAERVGQTKYSRDEVLARVQASEVELDAAIASEKIILFRADEILTAVGETMDYDEFMEAWDGTLTSPMTSNEQLLRGLALVKTDSFNKTIIKLDANSFSFDPATRFQQLFAVQKEWTLDSIMPYVTPLCSPGERPATILAKYSRSSIHPITKLKSYNSRYGVK